MKSIQSSIGKWPFKQIIPAELLILLVARIIIHLLLYQSGFISLTADEFSRTIVAARWAQNPSLSWHGAWLPFHMYMIGAALKFVWELLLIPRIISVILGVISIVLMYRLSFAIFGRKQIALISSILLTFNPAHIWISSIPVSEILHSMLILGFAFFLIKFLKNNHVNNLFSSAFLLAIANGVRYEAWIFAAPFSLLLILFSMKNIYHRRIAKRDLGYFFIAAVSPWIFPIAWILGNFIITGNPIYFFDTVKSYELIWYGQIRQLSNYIQPILLIDPYSGILAVFGIFIVFLNKFAIKLARFYSIFAVVPASLFAFIHGGQTEPMGIYIRHLAPFIFMLYPLIANFVELAINTLSKIHKIRVILLTTIMLVMTLTQTYMTFNFLNDPAAEGLAVGVALRSLRENNQENKESQILIELSYWQYQAIIVGANDINSIVYDRPLDLENRESVSVFDLGPESIEEYLTTNDIKYIVVRSPELSATISEVLGLKAFDEVNGYLFYLTANTE